MRKLIYSQRYFFLSILLLHIFYFICAIYIRNIYTGDSDEYLQTAKNLLFNGTYYNYFPEQPYRADYESMRPPLYGIFLIMKYIISSDHLVLALQNLMSISMFAGLLFLFKKSEVKPYGSLLFLAALAFPTHFILTNMIMADLLLAFLIFWSFFCLYIYIHSKKIKYLWLYNALLLLALLTKPILLYFWLINIPFSIWLFYKDRRMAVILGALLLPAGAFLWSAYNYQQTGYFHYSSIKSQNLLDMNAKYLLIKKYDFEYADSVKKVVLTEAVGIEDFKEQKQFIEAKAVNIIKNDIPTYIFIHIRGMINFFVDPGRVDMVEFFPVQQEEISLILEIDKNGFQGILNYLQAVSVPMLLLMLLAFIVNIFLLLSFLIYLFQPGNMTLRIWLFLMVGYTAFIAGAFGYARFRMSIWMLMLFTVPFAIEYIQLRIKNRLRTPVHQENIS